MKYFILVLALFAFPLFAAAENISILPPGWDPPGGETDPLPAYDFGLVPIGESASAVFEVHSLGPTPLAVYSVELTDSSDGVFTITDIGPIPPELEADDWFTMEIMFTPPSTGFFDGAFTIVSNDRETPVIVGPVIGEGYTVPEPGTFAVWPALALGWIGLSWRRRRRG